MSHQHDWMDATALGDEFQTRVCAVCGIREEHWHPGDPGSALTDCERCGERRVCQLVTDPFVVEEISEEDDGPAWVPPMLRPTCR